MLFFLNQTERTYMKKSLFRWRDILELSLLYGICFMVNFAFHYTSRWNLTEYSIVEEFLENLFIYRKCFLFVITLVTITFHYQMLGRKKDEIHCKILVGDTRKNIILRNIVHNFIILSTITVVFIALDISFGFEVISDVYCFCIFAIYIFVGTIQVKRL